MKTFAFTRGTSGGRTYFALVHTAAPPLDEEWSEYVAALTATVTRTSDEVRSLIATDGGAPSAPQRKALAGAFEKGIQPPFSHIFSDDAFVRGVVTAFRWVARARATAHSPSEFVAVCAQCSLPHEQVLYDMMTLQKTMPAIHTLREISESLSPPRLQTRI